MRDLNTGNPAENSLEFEIPSWDQIYDLTLKLAETVRTTEFEADLIVGVSRGGWIPARIMSDLLGNRNLANVTAEFYVGVAETKQEPSITQPVSASVDGKKVLVVDDLADTGKSLKIVNAHLKNQGASGGQDRNNLLQTMEHHRSRLLRKRNAPLDSFPLGTKRNSQKNCRKICRCRKNRGGS